MPTFKQVDVFTKQKYKGNPVAVFFDADNLTSEDMANMSAWTNLSEATFIQKPVSEEADYKVRIFSLRKELPFAGHPTIGTCHALLEAGLAEPKNNHVIQECEVGLVKLELSSAEDREINFQLPYAARRDLSSSEILKVTNALGVDTAINAAVYDVGPVWLTIQLDCAKTVLELKPDIFALKKISLELNVTGFQVLGKYVEGESYETRTFAPAIGVVEDPVCGSGSGATAAFLRDSENRLGTIRLSQGKVLNRAGEITITVGPDIYVGGNAVTVIDGVY
ncbi:uncharacterized protein PRCAT00003496001 [Priceomyces carsonii]|uniref:uncharacterized protein n=1 Tax=Priceomyces carsonii TaxID=28549 RepID=UPI002ED91176|nr:unnamed protein product [Priceomyces carsonii]